MAIDIRAARHVNATVMVSGITIPVSNITLIHSINELPYVQFQAQLDNRTKAGGSEAQIGAVKLSLEKFNKLTRLATTHVLDDFSLEPDCQVTVTDGEGRTIAFNGFLSQPEFGFQHGQVSLKFGAAHAKAVLGCFNPRIYLGVESFGLINFQKLRSDWLEDRATRGGGVRYQEQERKFNNVASWFGAVLREGMSLFPDPETSPEREPLWDSVHALNKAVLDPYVNEVLDLSETGTVIPGVDDYELSGLNPENLLNNLYRLISYSPNLLRSIYGTLDMFLLQLNANWGGDLWLEHRTMLEPYHAVIQASPDACNYKLSHLIEPPILQAIVECVGGEFYGISRAGGEQESQFAAEIREGATQPSEPGKIPALSSRARYPEIQPARTEDGKPRSGTYLLVNAPNWIENDIFTLNTVNELKTPGPELKASIDFYRNRRKDITDQSKSRGHILNYLAEFAYKSSFLEKTSGTVSVPMILGTDREAVQPGRVYRVASSVTGQPLFDGYLVQVQHSIAIDPEGGSAMTLLQFSHIRPPTD